MKLKKVLAVTLTAALSMGLMVGCGGDKQGGDTKDSQKQEEKQEKKDDGKGENASSGKKAKLSLAMWDANQQPVIQDMIDAYCKDHQDVEITIEMSPFSDIWTKLETGMAGGNASDLMWLNAVHAETYVDAGMIMDLTDKVAASDLDLDKDFPEAIVNLYRMNDKVYAIPKDFDTNAVWYNKKLFDEANVEYPKEGWTWEDMVEKARALTDPEKGVYGIAAPMNYQSTYYNTIFANGGWVLNEDKTENGYNDPKTIEGVKVWIDLIEEGLSPTFAQLTETSFHAMFQSEKTAMNWAGSYMTPAYANDENIADHIDLVPLPTLNGGESNVLHGLGYAVFVNSPHADEAADFAIWMGSKDAQTMQGKAGIVISARNDCQGFFTETHPEYNLKAYTDKAAIAQPLPVCLAANQLYDTEQEYLKQAWALEMSVEDACHKAYEDINKILK